MQILVEIFFLPQLTDKSVHNSDFLFSSVLTCSNESNGNVSIHF